jgi:hypothetical protein
MYSYRVFYFLLNFFMRNVPALTPCEQSRGPNSSHRVLRPLLLSSPYLHRRALLGKARVVPVAAGSLLHALRGGCAGQPQPAAVQHRRLHGAISDGDSRAWRWHPLVKASRSGGAGRYVVAEGDVRWHGQGWDLAGPNLG